MFLNSILFRIIANDSVTYYLLCILDISDKDILNGDLLNHGIF